MSDNNKTPNNNQADNLLTTDFFDTPPLPQNPNKNVNSPNPSLVTDTLPEIKNTPPISTQIKRKGPKKIVATILGLTVILGGLSAGIFLSKQSQEIREKAQTTEESTPPPTVKTVLEIDCLGVKGYSLNNGVWTLLTQADLSKLKAGDKVYFTVTGKASNPSGFTKARFRVNNESTVEVLASTNTKPRSPNDPVDIIEIYMEYTIPVNTTTFTIQASIFHSIYGWIGEL